MKKLFVIVILPAIILALGYLIVESISKPVRFNHEVKRRETVTVERLKDIRTLQLAFKSKYNRFTPDLDSLIDFYQNGIITIVRQVGSLDDSVAVAQKKVFRDSIPIFVRDTLLKRPGFISDSIKWIPFSGGKTFLMESVIRTVSGVPVPLFEASAPYDDLLLGLDRQLIINLKAEKVAMNRYPGLRVGSIEAPNNSAGNWE